MLADLRRVRMGITDAPTQSRAVAGVPRFGGRRKVAKAVAAFAAVALAIYGALGAGRDASPPAVARDGQAKVVAVLPLEGAGADPQTESLAAGVADSVITSLSRMEGLSVVSRSATLKYRDRKTDPDVIARELGATLCVDGLVQRSGDKLRVSVSVIEPGSKTARWQHTYNGAYADVFELQREVAEAVATAVRLPRPRDDGISTRPTRDLEAFADYSQARAFYERPDVRENIDRSIALYKSAIHRDPRFARAHAGLGEAYWRKYQATRDEQWSLAARDAINEALRLDPADASVRLGMAIVYRGLGRTEQALEELKTVIGLSPQSDEAHRQLGLVLIALGKADDGIAAMREAIRLRPNYVVHHQTLGTAFYNLGRFAEAARSFERMVELQPDSAVGYNLLGSARHAMDDTEAAVTHFQRAVDLGNPNAYANLGFIQTRLGRYLEAIRNLEEAVRRDAGSPALHLNLAEAYALAGRDGDAKAAYERALDVSRGLLRVSPADQRARANMAVIESKLGRHDDAVRHADEAVAGDPNNKDAHFNRAIVLVRAGRLEAATRALEDAVRSGYSRKHARAEPDLEPLRGRPEYESLMAGDGRSEAKDAVTGKGTRR
jgi:protein kinase/serine/threonine-protein kinase